MESCWVFDQVVMHLEIKKTIKKSFFFTQTLLYTVFHWFSRCLSNTCVEVQVIIRRLLEIVSFHEGLSLVQAARIIFLKIRFFDKCSEKKTEMFPFSSQSNIFLRLFFGIIKSFVGIIKSFGLQNFSRNFFFIFILSWFL